jgi:heme-degrading monooxygenase HmoA
MYIHMAIHRPHPDKEQLMLDSMRRFGTALKKHSGLHEVYQLKDEQSGALIGLAIWESEDAMQAAVSVARNAIKNDDHASWESNPPEVFHLNPM